MQISSEQVTRILGKGAHRDERRDESAPVRSVQELAEKFGVNLDEVRRFTQAAMMEDEDPIRERRVRELARRVAEGSYSVAAEDLVDMAERRAIADQSDY
jgi:anti-sigma28 factor (negative regulator of flagellin synthesis)